MMVHGKQHDDLPLWCHNCTFVSPIPVRFLVSPCIQKREGEFFCVPVYAKESSRQIYLSGDGLYVLPVSGLICL